MSRLANPFISCVGLAENILPVASHLVSRAARALRPRADPVAVRPAVRPEDIAPKVVPDLAPRPRRLERYLALTDGLDLRQSARRALPPLYPSAWGVWPYLELFANPSLDVSLLGIVHAQNDLIVHSALRPHEHLALKLSVERLQRDGGRCMITLLAEYKVGSRPVFDTRSVLVTGLSPSEASRAGHRSGVPREGWRQISRVSLSAHHALGYALLSGDVNPLHLHPITSRPFGFDNPILHGFCLKGLVVNALVRSDGAGDFTRLARLRLRFRTAVELPATLDILTRGPRVRVLSAGEDILHAEGRYRMCPSRP